MVDRCLLEAFASVHAAPGDEPRLQEYFVPTEAIQEVVTPGHHNVVFVGSKGAGKTAAFRYLSDFGPKPDITVGISPRTHELAMPEVDVSPGACALEFEYEITLELLRAYGEYRKRTNLARRALGHVEEFLEVLSEAGGRVRGVNILGSGVSIGDPRSKTVAGLVGRQRVAEARETLQTVCDRGQELRLVIDDPEEVFSGSASLDTNLIGGLLLALGSLSQVSPQFKAIALVKSYVFEGTRRCVPDLDHYYPRGLGRLWWNQGNLSELLKRRVTAFCGDGSWPSSFLGPKVKQKALDELWEYVLPRLLSGARDLVKWTQLALDNAGRTSRAYVSVEDFKASERVQSENSIETLCVAESSNYPWLENVISHMFGSSATTSFKGKEALTGHIARLYSKDEDFRRLFQEVEWLAVEDSSTLPRKLLRIGVLGLRAEGRLILPYSENYSDKTLELADEVFLAPALVPAVGRRPERKARNSGRPTTRGRSR